MPGFLRLSGTRGAAYALGAVALAAVAAGGLWWGWFQPRAGSLPGRAWSPAGTAADRHAASPATAAGQASSGARAAADGADDNPFRIVQDQSSTEDDCLVDLIFEIHEVDFSGQVVGEVETGLLLHVVAEGSGETPETALQDAQREAVRQVIAQFVDVPVLLEHRERIEQEVLARSSALILEHTVLVQEARHERPWVRLSAAVNRAEVLTRLHRAGIPLRPAED